MKKQVIWSLVLIALYATLQVVYGLAKGPIEAGLATGQLADSNAAYALSRAAAMGKIVYFANWVLFGMLVVIWVPVLFRKVKDGNNMAQMILLAGISVALLSACGPALVEKVEEIQPNQTAFLVPLEGATKSEQAKFMSIEYLNSPSVKVATKRVTIPQRKRDTGRMWWDYEWIPTVKMIPVDRTPVTRQWTQLATTGTSTSNEAICVESLESVDFCAGAIAIGSILEEDAAKFLYYYAGKPLSKVMDEDVRGFAGSVLAREFGARALDKGRREKNQIFETAFKETRAFFAERGVTVAQLGSTEGLQYKDEKIQKAINDTFVAENDKIKANFEKLAQAERNELNVQRAVAERKSAEEFEKAKAAQIAKIGLEIEMKRAEAMLEAARNLKDLKGQLPSVLPPGSTLLFGLDKPLDKK